MGGVVGDCGLPGQQPDGQVDEVPAAVGVCREVLVGGGAYYRCQTGQAIILCRLSTFRLLTILSLSRQIYILYVLAFVWASPTCLLEIALHLH